MNNPTLLPLPAAFEAYTKELFGPERYARFCQGLTEEPPVSIRLNPFKRHTGRLNGQIAGSKVPWCADAYYLTTRPDFTFDPLLHAGVYYVQEASSMIVDHIIRHFIDKPVLALDLCAAPGGKTTCAMSALPQGSLLFSNEAMGKRAQILAENVTKYGHEDIVVTNNYAADYAKTSLTFDLILADVPCSGEGMFRKTPEAIGEWSEANVSQCWQLQRSIVADIWPRLKPGGLMIYSTCTFNALENEDNVAWIAEQLGADVIAIPTQEAWQVTGALKGALPVCRFIPGFTRGEGLFVALLRKRGEHTDGQPTGSHVPTFDEAKRLIKNRLTLLAHGVMAPMAAAPKGKGKEKTPPPHISEALTVGPAVEAYPTAAVSYEQAVAYLRHEAITLGAQVPRGIVVVSYEGHPLGFAKNIGQRANNLYPKEWKIRTTYRPEQFQGPFE